MVVVYYTQTYYLDAVLELLQHIKKIAVIHLFIEVTPDSATSTIVHLKNHEVSEPIVSCLDALKRDQNQNIKKYLEGLTNAFFVIYPSRKSVSYSTYTVSRKLSDCIDQINPDLLHFDTISVRTIALYKFFIGKPICISIHDPLPHSGEYSYKTEWLKRLLYPRANSFIFYSSYAMKVFNDSYSFAKVPKALIRFQPYTVFKSLYRKHSRQNDYLLFVGRISLYKGIDLLLNAFPKVLESYPDIKLVIAGRPENYSLPQDIIKKYHSNIHIIQEYLSPENLATLIHHSKFVICPYRDATQSGVLMTAFALGKTVVATCVGSFPEYILDGFNGILSNPDPMSISSKIIAALNNKFYLHLEKNVVDYKRQEHNRSVQVYHDIYRQTVLNKKK